MTSGTQLAALLTHSFPVTRLRPQITIGDEKHSSWFTSGNITCCLWFSFHHISLRPLPFFLFFIFRPGVSGVWPSWTVTRSFWLNTETEFKVVLRGKDVKSSSSANHTSLQEENKWRSYLCCLVKSGNKIIFRARISFFEFTWVIPGYFNYRLVSAYFLL